MSEVTPKQRTVSEEFVVFFRSILACRYFFKGKKLYDLICCVLIEYLFKILIFCGNGCHSLLSYIVRKPVLNLEVTTPRMEELKKFIGKHSKYIKGHSYIKICTWKRTRNLLTLMIHGKMTPSSRSLEPVVPIKGSHPLNTSPTEFVFCLITRRRGGSGVCALKLK